MLIITRAINLCSIESQKFVVLSDKMCS